jgi:hypothetical protein
MATARIYANRTGLVEEALARAPEALELENAAPVARRSTAWIEYGYRRWLEDQAHEEKIRAYQELAGDRERLDIIKRSSREAVEAGIW